MLFSPALRCNLFPTTFVSPLFLLYFLLSFSSLFLRTFSPQPFLTCGVPSLGDCLQAVFYRKWRQEPYGGEKWHRKGIRGESHREDGEQEGPAERLFLLLLAVRTPASATAIQQRHDAADAPQAPVIGHVLSLTPPLLRWSVGVGCWHLRGSRERRGRDGETGKGGEEEQEKRMRAVQNKHKYKRGKGRDKKQAKRKEKADKKKKTSRAY